MGHITSKSYLHLQKRLDKNAQGAPASDTLFRILEILFTEKEAELVSKLPIRLFTAADAAKRWKIKEDEAEKLLDELADKGLLMDFEKEKTRAFVLPPTMAGFFEFSLMRTDGRFDRKVLSELFYQYINQEEDFVRMLFGLNLPADRTLIHEETIPDKSVVLDYEMATCIINTASCITVGICYCRHKMSHLGKACDMPQEVCLTFNNAAESLAKHGIARKISKEEAMKILDLCKSKGLVQIGDNVQKGVNWMCNCCGCCCEALQGYKRLGYKSRIQSNYLAVVDNEKCASCKLCVTKCPVEAIAYDDKTDKIVIDAEKCIGCGVCARFCSSHALSMKRVRKQYVPRDSFERIVVNAIEEGKLQDYIFDNYDLWTNELLREFLKVILKLTPRKLLMANMQLRSRFLAFAEQTKMHELYEKLFEEGKSVKPGDVKLSVDVAAKRAGKSHSR
ncbi:4Fe-4S binding protein [Candidatus Woesearchaeota archaeon]|nr:4Fe-4S binding protein [Candidatus Woesearchaeota archaeon]